MLLYIIFYATHHLVLCNFVVADLVGVSAYQVYRGRSIANNANLTSFITVSQSVCNLKCAGVIALNQYCTASFYNSSSGMCLLAIGLMAMSLNLDTAQSTTVLTTAAFTNRPLLWLPLSQTNSYSFDANFGTATLTNPPTLTGAINTINTPYPLIEKTYWFPFAGAVTTNLPTPYVQVQDTSPTYKLHIFGASFTIGVFTLSNTYIGDDVPVLEFLGPSTGQMCATLRMGYYGTYPQLFASASCSCSATPIKWDTPDTTTYVGWTHYMFTYDSSTNQGVFYKNGTLSSRTQQPFPTLSTTVTRLVIGSSECNRYRGYSNGYWGSIACILLDKSSYSASQVLQAYQLCMRQSALVMV